MNKKKAIAILIFLLCMSIPILTLALFPSTMGEDLYAMFFYFPLIFLVGGISAWAYYKYGERVKIHKAVWLVLILFLDFDYQLDLEEGTFSFSDTVETIDFQMTISYPDFGVRARLKDIRNLRVIVFETKPKFDYGFTKLFEKYLNITQGTKEKIPTV